MDQTLFRITEKGKAAGVLLEGGVKLRQFSPVSVSQIS